MTTYAHNTAIVGLGATEFSKNSGRSELKLGVEAALAACADAGITFVGGLAPRATTRRPLSAS